MKSLFALFAAGSLAMLFASCERHSWEGETKKLFEEHHPADGGGTAHKPGEDKAHP